MKRLFEEAWLSRGAPGELEAEEQAGGGYANPGPQPAVRVGLALQRNPQLEAAQGHGAGGAGDPSPRTAPCGAHTLEGVSGMEEVGEPGKLKTHFFPRQRPCNSTSSYGFSFIGGSVGKDNKSGTGNIEEVFLIRAPPDASATPCGNV